MLPHKKIIMTGSKSKIKKKKPTVKCVTVILLYRPEPKEDYCLVRLNVSPNIQLFE